MIKSILKSLIVILLLIPLSFITFYIYIIISLYIDDRTNIKELKNTQIINDKTFEIEIEHDNAWVDLKSDYTYRLFVIDKDERILIKEDNYKFGYGIPYKYVFFKNNEYFLVRAKDSSKYVRIQDSLIIVGKRMFYDIDIVKLDLE